MGACFWYRGLSLAETKPVGKGIQKCPIVLGTPLRLSTSAVACINKLSQLLSARCCRPVRRSLTQMHC